MRTLTFYERVFLTILIVNLIIAIIYLILNLLFWKKDPKAGCWVRTVVILLCPITGAAMLFLAWIFRLLFFHKEVDLADVVFAKDRSESRLHADEDRERNMIPVEEALEIAGKEEMRNLVLDVLRGDVRKSLSSIALALDSEDSETAHYAASVLQDILDGFREDVRKMLLEIKEEKRKEDEEEADANPGRWMVLSHQLIAYMDPILKQHVLSGTDQKTQAEILDGVCEQLYLADPTCMDGGEYAAAALRLLESSDFDASRKWCGRMGGLYPDELGTYTCRLKLHFATKERKEFFQALDELKASGVFIDRETLEMIRVFM